MYIYPSHFNCAWAVEHMRCMYTVTWARAQSHRVNVKEQSKRDHAKVYSQKEQLKRDHAEIEQKQSKHDRARARKRKQRDIASEESKTKEKESDRLRKKQCFQGESSRDR